MLIIFTFVQLYKINTTRIRTATYNVLKTNKQTNNLYLHFLYVMMTIKHKYGAISTEKMCKSPRQSVGVNINRHGRLVRRCCCYQHSMGRHSLHDQQTNKQQVNTDYSRTTASQHRLQPSCTLYTVHTATAALSRRSESYLTYHYLVYNY